MAKKKIRSYLDMQWRVYGAISIIIMSFMTGGCLSDSDTADFVKPGFVTPGDNLVIEEIPSVPNALAEELSRYTEVRSAFFTSWHPLRREILFNTRLKETAQVHTTTTPGGERVQLTSFPDRAINGVYDPIRGDYFVFRKDKGGNEAYQFYRQDIKTGEVVMLTDGTSRHENPTTSRSSGDIAYMRIRKINTEVFSELHVMNPLDPKTDRKILEFPGGGFTPQNWSPDNKTIFAQETVSPTESYLWLVNVATGEKTLLTPKGSEKILYVSGEFSPNNPNSLYTITDKDSEFLRLTQIDLVTKKYTYLTSDINWDVEMYAVSPNGKYIAFVTNENGISVMRLQDIANKTQSIITQVPQGVIGSLSWHNNSRDLGMSLTTSNSPQDAYSIDIVTRELTRWTSSETGGIDLAAVPKAQLVFWNGTDGKIISGFLYAPPPKFTGPRPVIINFHGGPEDQSRPNFLGSNSYFTNELGIAMIFPNIRGSTGYGKLFLAAANGLKREDAYSDAGALLDWIRTQPTLDASHVMVMGGSYGGHMALVTAARYADKIRSALSYVGISNLRTFLENTESYRRDLRRAVYGNERIPEIREWMERTAPLNNAAKITKPLFVVQGANDPRVPKSEAIQITQTVRKQGTPAWFLMADDEGHGFVKKKNKDYYLYTTALFVQKYLLGN